MTTRDKLLQQVKAGNVEETPSGLLLPTMGARAFGEYLHRKNDEPWVADRNTMTYEYLDYLLTAGMKDGAKLTTWYMSLFGVGQTPDPEWTAVSFAALSTENTDAAEGYDAATRPAYPLGDAVDGAINNADTPVRFTFATTSSVNIGGIALFSDNTRGGSTGILVSAANLATQRTFEDGDTYDVIYRLRFDPQ